jgi:hypothetical protein
LFDADEEIEQKAEPKIKQNAKLWNDEDGEDELSIAKK